MRLREIEPPIWRTVEVPGSSTLEDVHFAIQVAMGWTNSHLHSFEIGQTSYGMADIDDTGDLELEDERKFRLEDLAATGASFEYLYDFGDSWHHDVTVKKVTSVSKPPRPRCTAGARSCPPEDCGGTGGYANVLRTIADPKHEDHADMVQWVGDFQPERFAVPKAGRDLREQMEEFRDLADDDGMDDIETDEVLDLPKPLVKAVLALEPMQRASLGALIAGSLADELMELRSVVGQLAAKMREQRKPARAGRRRARS
ncbi:MAG: plasmid pRiA4b ORF-3 family protein [Deltaproteobacteria bacterium]|nr:plasmid pRiA4b ORF-3 family protein [Deltaproteobacteria bacterium]